MSAAEQFENNHHPSPPACLAEVRARILADAALPETRRRDMASALNSLAKALGQPAEIIPANPAALRPLLAGLTPAMVRMKPGRWRNVLSLTTAALAQVGLVVVQGRLRTPPSAMWLAILRPLEVGAGPHFHLWRFARYCTDRGIDPAQVDDVIVAAYQRDLDGASLVSEPARAAREVARFWNAAAATKSDWPQQRLSVPDNRRGFAPDWAAFPESLNRDIAAWLDWLGAADPFNERPFAPLRPTSLATRRRQLRSYLGALVQQGAAPQDLVDLAAVVTPQRAESALRFYWDRAAKQPTTHLHQMAGLVLQIARHWARLPDAHVARLEAMVKRLKPARSGMSERNAARLRALEDPTRLRALLTLPAVLLVDAQRIGAPGVEAARLAELAAAIEILLHIPVRFTNLRGLRIGAQLLRGPGGAISVSIPAAEVKNAVAIDGVLPPASAKLIATYIDRFRPVLAVHGGAWLFPSIRPDRPKSDDGLRSAIQKVIAERCGLEWGPHTFRHLAAYLWLRANPGQFAQVQRLLGHKSLQTTMSFYSGLEAVEAVRPYDHLVARLREQDTPGRPAGPAKPKPTARKQGNRS
jgi:integrase